MSAGTSASRWDSQSKLQQEQYDTLIGDPARSYKVDVQYFGVKVTHEERLDCIAKLSDQLDWKGPVSLYSPDVIWELIVDFGRRSGVIQTKEPPTIRRIFFGRQVATGQRQLLDIYTLKKRKYLGTTSMECEASFFSANMGHVRHI